VLRQLPRLFRLMRITLPVPNDLLDRQVSCQVLFETCDTACKEEKRFVLVRSQALVFQVFQRDAAKRERRVQLESDIPFTARYYGFVDTQFKVKVMVMIAHHV